jgi:hypothetical protein
MRLKEIPRLLFVLESLMTCAGAGETFFGRRRFDRGIIVLRARWYLSVQAYNADYTSASFSL